MIDIPQQMADAFTQACHQAAAQQLLRCSSGNLSLRLDADRLIATASGS